MTENPKPPSDLNQSDDSEQSGFGFGLDWFDAAKALDESQLQLVKIGVERLAGRQRRIFAKIQIPYSVEQIWQLLTEYERLADFIPNLAESRRLPHPEGGIRIEQIGKQLLLNIRLCARVVLDMEEMFPNEIRFQMIEGDFKGFVGSWQLNSIELENGLGTELCYNLTIHPRLTMPVAIVEHRLRHDLTLNLLAIRERATEVFA